jgi:hypothetical protein
MVAVMPLTRCGPQTKKWFLRLIDARMAHVVVKNQKEVRIFLQTSVYRQELASFHAEFYNRQPVTA